MRASVGDRIVVASTVIDQAPRDGRVVEVRHPDGTPPYVVEWSDSGEQTLVFPGPDAHIEHVEASATPAPPAQRVVKTWTVTLTIAEEGDETTATAVLAADAEPVDAVGRARRNPHDPATPVIGDEVAVSRALRHLADRLIETADEDIRAHTGSSTHLVG